MFRRRPRSNLGLSFKCPLGVLVGSPAGSKPRRGVLQARRSNNGGHIIYRNQGSMGKGERERSKSRVKMNYILPHICESLRYQDLHRATIELDQLISCVNIGSSLRHPAAPLEKKSASLCKRRSQGDSFCLKYLEAGVYEEAEVQACRSP